MLPCSKGLDSWLLSQSIHTYRTILDILFQRIYVDFQSEIFLLQSPLLEESLLVSFPPLNYMLKFSG